MPDIGTSLSVAYLPETRIERDAEALLLSFATAKNYPIGPPIPVEKILESHLGIYLAFDNLQATHSDPQALGAVCFDARTVFIDESLDPDVYPDQLGRYRFTIAHEIGHWVLHRSYIAKAKSQTDAFLVTNWPDIICRAGDSKVRIEYQANHFASYLLMPKAALVKEWSQCVSPEDLTDEWAIRDCANTFQVSIQAMGIRLRQTGLIKTWTGQSEMAL